MKRKNGKKGISLIVLVITIIVMIILAATIIISLNNSGVINRANEAVNASNVAQVQQLASMIWADAYLDEVQNIDEAYIKVKLEENGVDTSKYNIAVTANGVTVTSFSENWKTIYQGNGYTETGSLVIANEYLFDPLNEYRITIEGQEYTGSLRTRLIYYNGTYFFASVVNNEATYYSSLEEAQGAISNLPEDAVLVAATQATDNNGAKTSRVLFFNKSLSPVTTGYSVTKIEKLEGGSKILYKGDIGKNSTVAIENADITHNYILMDENGIYVPVFYNGGYLFVATNPARLVAALVTDDSGNTMLATINALEDIELYDLGRNSNIAREGDYLAIYKDDSWTLFAWPDNIKTLPQTVEGKTITAIMSTTGAPLIYYDRELDIIFEGDLIENYVYGNIEVAAGVNPQKIFTALQNRTIYKLTLDLSALNEVAIPENILNKSAMSSIIIYVSEAVKANYKDYEVVKIKE